MKHLINIKKSLSNYPKLSSLGLQSLQQYWKIKSVFQQYNYPTIPNAATISKELVLNYNKNRLYGPQKRICYAVFNNLHIDRYGNVNSCSFNADLFLGNLNENSLTEIWNGEKRKNFEHTLGNYNLDKCMACKAVIVSKNYSSFPGLKYDLHSNNEATFPTQMSFELSDLCNYACIMCSEDYSTAIKKNKNIPIQKNKIPLDFIDQLDEFLPHLKIATFIGGEPMLIKIYYQIWEKIIAKNKNCSIHVQTNGSLLSPRFLDLLKTGQFEIGVSLDAPTKETFEKIRLNADFDIVKENINILIDYKNKGLISLNFNFCPLVQNWKEMPQMINYANEVGVPIKILNVTSPHQHAIYSRNSAYILNVIQFLKNAQIIRSEHFVSDINIKVFETYIEGISYFYDAAVKRESDVEILLQSSIDVLQNKFIEILLSNKRFELFNQLEQQLLVERCCNPILKQNELPAKNVFAKMILILEIANNDEKINDAKSVEVKIKKVEAVISELIELETQTDN